MIRRMSILLTLTIPCVLSACGSLGSAQPNATAVSAGAYKGSVFTDLGYEKAGYTAENERKLLLVDATAVWCGPCKKMDRDTWTDDRVKTWIREHAIAVKVDVDREKKVAESLGISAMPTMILMKNGRELARVVGYMGPDQLLDWLSTFVG